LNSPKLLQAVEIATKEIVNMNPLLFRQLFHSESSTYTYLIADKVTGDAVLIDPVLENVDR